jgi:hypothetical protein
MQQPKRGNGHRLPKRRRHYKPAMRKPEISRSQGSKPGAVVRLTLHDTDPITGSSDKLFTCSMSGTEATPSTAPSRAPAASTGQAGKGVCASEENSSAFPISKMPSS